MKKSGTEIVRASLPLSRFLQEIAQEKKGRKESGIAF